MPRPPCAFIYPPSHRFGVRLFGRYVCRSMPKHLKVRPHPTYHSPRTPRPRYCRALGVSARPTPLHRAHGGAPGNFQTAWRSIVYNSFRPSAPRFLPELRGRQPSDVGGAQASRLVARARGTGSCLCASSRGFDALHMWRCEGWMLLRPLLTDWRCRFTRHAMKCMSIPSPRGCKTWRGWVQASTTSTYLSEHMVTCARTHQVQQTGNFARELFVRFPETACLAYERILTHIPPRFTGPPQSRLDSAKLGSASDSW